MKWRASTVRHRLGIPLDEPLLAWVMADYRGLQVPGPRMSPTKYWPPCLALTGFALSLSNAGVTRRYILEDIVLASLAPSPVGALRIDFMDGDPLIVLVVDNGAFYGRLVFELRSLDRRLQMKAPHAFGLPDLPPEMVAAAERAKRCASQLLAENGRDPKCRLGAEQLEADARELIHEAQVTALRTQRTELLAGTRATLGDSGI